MSTPDFRIEHDDGAAVLRLHGHWTIATFAALEPLVSSSRSRTGSDRIDVGPVARLDSAGALLIAQLLKSGQLGIEAVVGAGPEQRALIAATLATLDLTVVHPRPWRWSDLLARIGAATTEQLAQAQRLLGFIGLVLATLPGVIFRPRRWRTTSVMHHIEQTGFDAMPSVTLGKIPGHACPITASRVAAWI